jgi:hypothetical protein
MALTNSIGPQYYRRGNVQVWDFIRDQGLNFHLGNAIKYICRAGHKESRIQDLTKAIHYLRNELEHELEIEQHADGSGVQERFPGEEQYNESFTGGPAAFDR